MAKRKNAAALFEVIHHDKRFTNRHATWSWPKINWWPKRKQRASVIDDDAPRGPSLMTRVLSLVPPVPRVGLESDPERQEIRFRLSYTAAVVSAFSLVVLIVLAFMIGRRGSRPGLPALADRSTEELRAGPAQPDVLDVHTGSGDGAGAMALASTDVPATPPTPSTAQQSGGAKLTNSQTTMQGVRPSHSEPRGPSTLMVTDAKRTVGLQYVVIQSYPPEEEKFAKAAVDLLNSNGVLCTLENGIPYAPRWICVVGVDGFNRTRNSPEYDQYIGKIRQIEAKAGGSSKFLKKFDPKPYPWKDKGKAE